MIPGRHYLSTLDLHQPDEINPISFHFCRYYVDLRGAEATGVMTASGHNSR